MSALGVDGKDLFAAARQQDGVVPDVAREHTAIVELLAGDAISQVEPCRLPLCGSHADLLRNLLHQPHRLAVLGHLANA
jgi:hypothetical protein